MFVNEVEKGLHSKPATIPKFRPDALKTLCEVVQENLETLDPEPEDDDKDGEKMTTLGTTRKALRRKMTTVQV
jgi:hypothetical protein